MKGTWVLGICLTVLMILVTATGATAGRNADGALILHTNDAYTYSSATKCTTPLARPATCEEAITRSDKAIRPVVWALWAFDSLATPAVTAVYFGLEMDEVCIDPYEIAWSWCSPTGVVPSQVVSAEWPGDGESATVSWPIAITENLFPFLCMRIDEELCGEPGAYISTSINHVGGYAAFIDDSNPPVTDLVEKFGTVRWYEEGENQCLETPGGDGGGGGEDSPAGDGASGPGEGTTIPPDPTVEEMYRGLDVTDRIKVYLQPGTLVIDREEADPVLLSDVHCTNSELAGAFHRAAVVAIQRCYPGYDLTDTLQLDLNLRPIRVPDISNFFILHFATPQVAMSALPVINSDPRVRLAWIVVNSASYPVSTSPNDPHYDSLGPITQDAQ